MSNFLDFLFHDLINELALPARMFASNGDRQELTHAWRAHMLCETGFRLLHLPRRRPSSIAVERARIAASIQRVASAEEVMVGRCTGEPQVTVPWSDDLVDLLLWNVVREAKWHCMRDSRVVIGGDCTTSAVELRIEYDGAPPSDPVHAIAVGERSLPIVSDGYRSDCGLAGAHAARLIGAGAGAEIEIASNENHQRISIVIRTET